MELSQKILDNIGIEIGKETTASKINNL